VDFNEARDDGVAVASAGPSFAPRSSQITIPAPHHSMFYRLDALTDAQPTVSEHYEAI